jgi:hypothetical protein
MDLSTLSLGPISFAGNRVVPPPGASSFATDVDLRPGQQLLVRISASLDPNRLNTIAGSAPCPR